jgi:predicted trehalose synthase
MSPLFQVPAATTVTVIGATQWVSTTVSNQAMLVQLVRRCLSRIQPDLLVHLHLLRIFSVQLVV